MSADDDNGPRHRRKRKPTDTAAVADEQAGGSDEPSAGTMKIAADDAAMDDDAAAGSMDGLPSKGALVSLGLEDSGTTAHPHPYSRLPTPVQALHEHHHPAPVESLTEGMQNWSLVGLNERRQRAFEHAGGREAETLHVKTRVAEVRRALLRGNQAQAAAAGQAVREPVGNQGKGPARALRIPPDKTTTGVHPS